MEDGVGGAGVSWPETGVGAFSASRQLSGVVPRGVFDLAGVLELDEGSVGDGRWLRPLLAAAVGGCRPMSGWACCNCCCDS